MKSVLEAQRRNPSLNQGVQFLKEASGLAINAAKWVGLRKWETEEELCDWFSNLCIIFYVLLWWVIQSWWNGKSVQDLRVVEFHDHFSWVPLCIFCIGMKSTLDQRIPYSYKGATHPAGKCVRGKMNAVLIMMMSLALSQFAFKYYKKTLVIGTGGESEWTSLSLRLFYYFYYVYLKTE